MLIDAPRQEAGPAHWEISQPEAAVVQRIFTDRAGGTTVPEICRSLNTDRGQAKGSLIPDSVRPVPYTNTDGSDGVDLYIEQNKFHAAFAGDVDPQTAR